jgi:RNA recognition motif-containing protein
MDEQEPIVAEEVEAEEVEGEEAKAEAGAEDEVGEEDETDAEIEAMKKRVKEMEEEAAKIEALQTTVEKSMKAGASGAAGAPPTGPAVDARSIYVGNVDYATTNDDLKEFFKACGTVNRVTIGMNKFTGEPKGCVSVRAALPLSCALILCS